MRRPAGFFQDPSAVASDTGERAGPMRSRQTEQALNSKSTAGFTRLVAPRCAALASLMAALLMAACSSGSSDGGSSPPPPPPPPVNTAPTANAGGDQNVSELAAVTLSGSGTDPENDTLTFAWAQTGGAAVVLGTPGSANATFTAPGAPQTLTFALTVTDPGGLSSTDSVNVIVQAATGIVTISGTLRYEFPPPKNLSCQGLDFNNVELRPIRQATVQLLDASGMTLIDSDVSDEAGAYSVDVPAGTDVKLRVLAETRRTGSPTWDVQVRNNLDDPANPLPLGQRALYAMDSTVFDSGATNRMLDLTATTGWGGSSYTGPRVAAPFSILDAIYSAMQFVAAEDPVAVFPPLDAFWSTENKSASPTDIDVGDLPTSFYDGQDRLFLLGLAGVDTEEFDDHIIVHEWGHYFEDNFSRSDSIGGSHAFGDALDKRVAFGEGFATALAGMVLDSPNYCDTGGTNSGFGINIESGNVGSNPGWFNEFSILKLIYDLWDTAPDGADISSIGFGPIYSVMTGPQRFTQAFTSVFAFATYLKQQLNASQNAFVDALLIEQGITANNIDIYGSTEANDGPGSPPDVFPLYTDLTLGVTETICANSQFDSGRDGNKLSEHRYLRLNLATNRSVTFTMTTLNPPSTPSAGFDCESAADSDPETHEHSDPDFLVYRNGSLFVVGFSCEPNSEVAASGTLAAGDYVIDINEFRHEDDESPAGYPEQVCFDFTAN